VNVNRMLVQCIDLYFTTTDSTVAVELLQSVLLNVQTVRTVSFISVLVTDVWTYNTS